MTETIDRLYLELSHVTNARNFRETRVLDIAKMWAEQGDADDKAEALRRIVSILVERKP